MQPESRPPSRRLREWLRKTAEPVVHLSARELEVADPRDSREWLRRLFMLPPPQPRDAETPAQTRLPRVLRQMGVGLGRLLRVLWTPMRVASERFDRVDFTGASARLDRTGERMVKHTGLRYLAVAVAAVLFWLCAATPLTVLEQALFLGLLWMAAIFIRRLPGNLATLTLIMFSLLASGRYIWWRFSQTLDFESLPEAVFGYALLMAEIYTWIIMLLGYIQNAWPLKRQPQPMPINRAQWPAVDVFIPTYNESLKVIKPAVYAALGLDWPRDKLNVYILDDGRRGALKEFAAEVGALYITRSENAHAKAGNLNNALAQSRGEYIAVFDCDHIATRSFLQTTMGWLLRDPKCAMVQTPHHFFSPDPFERNLGTFREVPNEGSLFYGLVQDGNDLWNATFFCGSCAVIRRGPLEQVGGIAVETVTEDAHTALKLHRLGYNTAYLNLTQAAGLATESLSGHIGQRVRWARGMAQIFRIDNPLFGKGLTLFQRLCYSNAMLHFFHAIPRLIFILAPLSFVFFGLHIIAATAWALALYALPHIIMAKIADSRMQGRYRHSFWASVYESVLTWYVMLPTTVAFINPKAGKFNVTAKGGLVEHSYFDWSISRPYLILISANLAGFVFGLWRLAFDVSEPRDTILLNLAWILFNLIMLGTTLGVAEEARQVRQAHRVQMRTPAALLAKGRSIVGETLDFSSGGLGLKLPETAQVPPDGTPVQVMLTRGDREFGFPARVTGWSAPRLGLRFDQLSVAQEAQLVQCTFGRADSWLDWRDKDRQDRPLDSLGEILRFGLRGYAQLYRRLPSMGVPRWLLWSSARNPASV